MRYRKHIRLKGFDYSSSHYYFVTLCTRGRKELFEPRVSEEYGHTLPDFVADVAMGVAATHASPDVEEIKRTTDATERCLLGIPEHFPNTEIDFYIFMSDHIHLILAITEAGAACRAATKRAAERFAEQPTKQTARQAAEQVTKRPSLGTIIGSFKSAASRLTGKPLWQPNYYEHIIRSGGSLDRIRNYLLRNPWIEYDEINWKHIDPS